jgi:hypothetical protein
MRFDPNASVPASKTDICMVCGALLACGLVHLYAGAALRGLYADGAHSLVHILATERFYIIDVSRLTPQVLFQAPVVLATHLGVKSVSTFALIYSLSLNLIPWLLTAACYFTLPKDKKFLFVLPVLAYVAGVMSASFAPIAEASTAAPYFWLLLCSILFAPLERRGRFFLFVLSAPALLLHEAMVFLGPVLALASYIRGQQEGDAARKPLRILCAWFLLAAVVEAGFVSNPRDPSNREFFFRGFVRLHWLGAPEWGWNVPAILGVLAIVSVAAIYFVPSRSRLFVGSFAAVSAALVLAAFLFDGLMVPHLQFVARNHPTFVSFGLAAVLLAGYWKPRTIPRWATPASVTVLVILAAGSFSCHLVATRDWVMYTRVFRELVATNRGLIEWGALPTRLTFNDARLIHRMNWHFTMPDMSVVMSPRGRVQSMLANPPWSRWQPYDPSVVATLPKSRFFDVGPYAEALKSAHGEAGAPR